MAKDEKRTKKVHVVDIVRHGTELVIPEHMSYGDAIQVLERKRQYEEEFVDLYEHVDAAPWDGALALKRAIEELFGFTFAQPTPGFFGDTPPAEISVEIGPGRTARAPWGQFKMPGTKSKENFIETGMEMKEGRLQFRIRCYVQRMYEPLVAKLAERTRELVALYSIYRSQAIRIRFKDDKGNDIQMPEPKFIDVSKADLNSMVYTRDLERAMDTNILTVLRHKQVCREQGIPLKRGVLLAGPYGCGKTLLANGVAKVATENGWTYVYIQDVRELPDAIKFARQYQPAVIFAEDIDRAMAGDRSLEMDKILNTIDGVDSKNSEIMVVLTTNHLEKINKAMLRPGRLDVVLNIVPPDAEAVQRLIVVYGRDRIAAGQDFTRFGVMLEGQIPAVIEEAVKRSKLEVIRRTGDPDELITAEDLEAAAFTMLQQQKLFESTQPDPHGNIKILGRAMGDAIGEQIATGINQAAVLAPSPLGELV